MASRTRRSARAVDHARGDRAERAGEHDDNDRGVQRVGEIVDDTKDVPFESGDADVPCEQGGGRDEHRTDGGAHHIAGMSFAGSARRHGGMFPRTDGSFAFHVVRQVADQSWGEDPLGESPAVGDLFESVVIFAGQDRVQALSGDLQDGEAAARRRGRAVDRYRHVGDLVEGSWGSVVVDDDVVVVGSGLGRPSQTSGVTGRAELGMFEQCGDTVEVAAVEQRCVPVNQRDDLVTLAHRTRIGTAAQPRTLPECTRRQPASSMS